jgi:uncharacterized Zn finger protein
MVKIDGKDGTRNCVECGSEKVHILRRRVLASGAKQVQLKCQECGKHHTVQESKWIKNERTRKGSTGVR